MEEQTDNKNLPTVKILISYHKPAVLLKDEVLTPIHVGRALATESSKDGSMSEEDYKWMLENMIGDDTGDNISHLNREFCELTSMYWAWKNYDKLGNPDYIGFMHYRRLFILNDNINKLDNKTPDSCNMIRYDSLDENYLVNLGLNIDNILKILDKNNSIVCSNILNYTPHEYHSSFEPIEQNYYRFISEIKEYQKNIINYIEKYLNGNEHFWSNMFIVSKEIFFDYCEFIFSFLFYFIDKLKFILPSISEKRTLAYVSEMLSGMWWTYIKYHKNFNIISYPVYFIENTDLERDIKPAFKDKNITVCFSSDNNYIKYLSVAIESLIEHSNENNNYDILIFEKEIKQHFKDKILFQISKHKNISVRFINIKVLANKYLSNINRAINHYNESIFYRYFIPQLLKKYNKVVYLDCDLIILDDIADLYNIDLENNSLGAVRDIEMHRWLKDRKIRQEKIDFNNNMGIKDSTKYFNSGVLVMNLKKMRELNSTSKLINITLDKLKTMWVGDQDVLNGFFYDDVKYIDTSWNIEWIVQLKIKDWSIEIDEKSYFEYKNALRNPKIIHYCDIYKPWKSPELELASIWWKYARMTDFYEEIIYKNCSNNIYSNNNRFSIADFILSVENSNNYFSIIILGIKLTIKKKSFVNNKFYESKIDRVFSIYKNNRYTRITILGIKITLKK
ncbi:DUF4422 domain-containing protein [Brachyspira aalborgi]|uniref:DUF4422 domain-containing protein n=1 Tax=Brachyspira aalborgi TaxID=29522 RepID=A0A5C8F6G1_9SPIR|nr:glycosyltransferase [Brachyspira aalborgi]TXJ44170.1 DUF4422 domain-containing protein [Brachyspira aalborgi]